MPDFDTILAYLYAYLVVIVIINVIVIAGVWATFLKAGKPGWASIIPIYNVIVFLEIAEKPIWWIILLLIPIVDIIIGIIALSAFVEKFGGGCGFVLGLIFLPVIFWPILGFGSAQYQPGGQSGRRQYNY